MNPSRFTELINLITRGDITEQIGRTVLEEMFRSGKTAPSIIEEKDLKPIQDMDALDGILSQVMVEHPDVVNQIMEGNLKPVSFLIGQVMKKTGGKANPKKVKDLIHEKLIL